MMKYVLITSTSAGEFQKTLDKYAADDWAIDLESFCVTETFASLPRFSILVEKGDSIED